MFSILRIVFFIAILLGAVGAGLQPEKESCVNVSQTQHEVCMIDDP